uniref:Mite allergen Tyr p 7 n=1 Tax=Tyrophagus putrescentiae TaxID=59818 RepID=B0KZL6_TYRPU|nr:mite allergen Tyr p 7 [Tyrophagus putrescentiae]
MKSAVLVLVACFAGIAVADNGNANQFVDQIVTALKTQKNFDPLVIPPHHMNIDRKIGAIHLKGTADLKETKITGLSHVRRVGDAVLKNENGSFTAKLHLGDDNVKLFSDISLHFLHNIIHPNLKVEIDIGNIGVGFGVTIGADGKPALKDFDIEEFKHVKIHVHGLGPLDHLVDLIGEAYISLANTQARHMITGIVRPILDQELKKL